MAMEKVKQELESMKAKLSSTQQSLAEKETHLTNLRAERRKHLEEVLEMKLVFSFIICRCVLLMPLHFFLILVILKTAPAWMCLCR